MSSYMAVTVMRILTPASLDYAQYCSLLSQLCHTEAAFLPVSEEGTEVQKMSICFVWAKDVSSPMKCSLHKPSLTQKLSYSSCKFLASFFWKTRKTQSTTILCCICNLDLASSPHVVAEEIIGQEKNYKAFGYLLHLSQVYSSYWTQGS